MLSLFHRMPAPEALQRRVCLAEHRHTIDLGIEHQIGHHGGEVLEADRGHQHTHRSAGAAEIDPLQDLRLNLCNGIFFAVDLVVQQVMLARMDGFLRDEIFHILGQLARNLAAIGFHRIHEHAFAVREGQRHGIVNGGGDGVAVQPGAAIIGGGHVKAQVARFNGDVFGGAFARHCVYCFLVQNWQSSCRNR